MNFEIWHNGKNIADDINAAECCSCDRYGGLLDDLAIVFAANSNNIEFNKDDTLEIRTAGGFTTGSMYIDWFGDEKECFTLKALSCRHENKKRKTKIWDSVKLSKIISDVAANTGLTPMLYGVEDYSYACVSQIMETDLQMLSRICKREGYSIKCDNDKLIVFNEFYLENNSTPISLSKADVSSRYRFNRSVNGLASMTVRYFNTDTRQTISSTATDGDISGGEKIRIEFLTDGSEAQRVARGYLRDANKLYITGLLEMAYNGGISAGTVVDLTDFEEWDGRYVVYEVRHDFVREKTLVKVRKVLPY